MKPTSGTLTRVTTDHFYFLRIDGTTWMEDSYSLRFQVYCQERSFLSANNYPDEREFDYYDDHSLHFAAFDIHDQMVGSVRLVCVENGNFPMLSHCEVDPLRLPSDVSRSRVAEISRLAVSKLYRRRADDGLYGLTGGAKTDPLGRRQKPEIVFGLYKIMYQESKRQGIQFWYAAMESSLERLLARYAFEFSPVGPEVDYYGPVTPFIADIAHLEKRVHAERPDIFQEFTAGLDPTLRPIDLTDAKVQIAGNEG